MTLCLALSSFALAVWLIVAMLPWQPHRTTERLEPVADDTDLSDVTVLIPARNEAAYIGRTLSALSRQGPGLKVVVIDDASSDATSEICKTHRVRLSAGSHSDPSQDEPLEPCRFAVQCEVMEGKQLPSGWGGKLWALQQGLSRADRRHTMLLDADIELAPRIIPALLATADRSSSQLVSVMARLQCGTIVEKLLVPPFVFFFKLLYPFALVRSARSRVAAAAGGCVLVETQLLKQLGGFERIRGELIDDCSLAALLKESGHGLWLGLSESVVSLRRYRRLREFWQMVSRTAYTQLRYSTLLLLLTTVLMIVLFWAPVLVLLVDRGLAQFSISAGAMLTMASVFMPTVRFYRLSPAWALTLPLTACLYLAMTWSSAINYWRGTRAQWKNRTYDISAR